MNWQLYVEQVPCKGCRHFLDLEDWHFCRRSGLEPGPGEFRAANTTAFQRETGACGPEARLFEGLP
jgi:hypothetical protein